MSWIVPPVYDALIRRHLERDSLIMSIWLEPMRQAGLTFSLGQVQCSWANEADDSREWHSNLRPGEACPGCGAAL